MIARNSLSPPGRKTGADVPAPRGRPVYRGFFCALLDKREWIEARGLRCEHTRDAWCRLPMGWVAMRLEANSLACIRGGREVFTGLGFSVGTGEALLVTGRNG